MASQATKERLRNDIALWFADGIIDQHQRTVLNERYEAQHFGWIGVIKYVGITGGLLAFFGLLGLVASMADSKGFTIAALGGIGGGFTYWGLRLARDVQDRYATSSKVIVTLGIFLATSTIALLCGIAGLSDEAILTVTGLLSLPMALFLAYFSHNTYLLILSLLGLFHWIGAWSTMWGRSSYVFAVQDPQVMCLAALAAIGIGIYHERQLYPQTVRFYQAWESLGLLYLNMSLLILSIWSGDEGQAMLWIGVFSITCLAQIGLGAYLQNGLMRGFGITFFAIDAFTRYHEWFWDQFSLGTYLLAGGLGLATMGGGLEALARARRLNGGAT
ncbi:hypothetical protein [uncultured Thiodictyon sp.]|uniref:hypothetical protein n=1 Tax=uncultured Thiodictyon sp. TaxID=1846217 RepID=UPI0025E26125|nr:hypothetical protein [uncultured Thiodictyon sp.]